MNDFWSIFSFSVGGASICSIALTFLLREWISNRLKKSIQHEYDVKLEGYKAGYQKLLDENRIAYSWWHEEQAKAIKETYGALSELYLSIDSKLCCMNKNNSCSNCDPALQNSYKNAKNIWSRNKIFFEEDFNKRITDIFTISFDIKTSVSQFNGCVHKRQSVVEYCQQNKEKIDSILLELRQQLRIVMSGRITEK